MNFVQIIYEDPVTNEVQEKSDLTPILLDNSDVKYGEGALGTDLVMHTEEATPSPTNPTKNLALGEWTNRETNYLLKKYNKYIAMTGIRKRFRTKRDMWCRISLDMKKDLNVLRTSGQCENRYKTVLRKWRKHNNVTINQENFAETEADDEQLPGPSSVSSELVQNNVDENCDELSNSNNQEEETENEKGLAKVLWDIFNKKEEGRERRHREKMELIKKFLNQLYE